MMVCDWVLSVAIFNEMSMFYNHFYVSSPHSALLSSLNPVLLTGFDNFIGLNLKIYSP